jgi:phosphoglycerol transferase MdoB-like AlkP superfamily enzyme
MSNLVKRLVSALKSSQFLFFVLTVMVMTVQMVITSYKLAEHTFYPMPSLRSLLQNHLCDTLLLSSFYWLLPARRKGWMWLLIAIVTVWCFANITYNETYRDMMPFASWLYVSNLGGVLLDSIMGTITAEALWVLALPLALLMVWLLWFRKRVARDTFLSRRRHRWIAVFGTILLAALLWLVFLSNLARYKSLTLKECYVEKYCELTNFSLKVYPVSNGNVPFVVYSIIKACDGVTEEQREQAKRFLKDEVPDYTDNPYCVAPSRNLVLIMVESLNAWVVDLKIDGREVCPVLNSLVADTASIACTQMMAQVKNGRSSDGMFIYNTGLLPLTGGSVAMDYGDNEYPSLTQALKGVDKRYRTMEITVDRTGMWNVERTAASYGFDSLYLQDAYREAYIKSGQSIDKMLLEFSANKIGEQRQPFYAMIFTGSTHIPYDKLEDVMEPTWISQSNSYTVNVRNYLEKVAFFDRQLGEFIEHLKKSGIYDKTVLVVASDHSDYVDDDPHGRAAISKRGTECMFVILNSGLPGRRIEGPVGQIDIYPTLLDIMGANSYWWKGLGYSLLRNDVKSAVLAPGDALGTSPLLNHQRQAWPISETLIKTNWWEKR